MTPQEVAPPRRAGAGLARGPPLRGSPDTRKTGLPPGLPHIGAVSAEQIHLRAVYPGWGRNPGPARSSARAHESA
jgi:hypothetical protein